LKYFFNEPRTAALAYRSINGVAVVLRDAVGPREVIEGLLMRFRDYCRTKRLRPCWLTATADHLGFFRQQGWRCLKLGEEALIDLPDAQLSGKAWQDVRTAMRRLPREGYSAVWYDLALDPNGWLPQLELISQAWLRRRKLGALGFTLGTWESAVQFATEQRFLVLANPRGVPQAFINFVPCYVRGGGWSIDLMRRAGRMPPGTMEFLIGTALRQFQQDGCAMLSLSLAPLADITPDSGGDAPEFLAGARQLVFNHFGQPYNFHGQARFKAKFNPRWEPRYLVFPRLRSLPRVLLAVMRAHRT
jgi:phosphatidylglycerol lysyltransferase